MDESMSSRMTTLRRISLLFVLFTLLPVRLLAQEAPAPQTYDMTEVTSTVDSIFEPWDHSERPGCAVGVARDGQTLFSKAYGMADLEHHVPNTSATIFEAGSISKQFVAAAIGLLVQDDSLSLDDDVREYVPELPDYGETITLRHLLTHTSGLRDWGSVAAISGWGRSSRTHDHDHVLDILNRQNKLNFPPGERYSYSNSGYNLAAIIVGRVSDQSFAEFSEERIFQPLGMTSTQWRDDYTRIVEGRSTAYSAENDSSFSINRPIEHVHGNGGLLTTVHDLLIWNEALESGRLGGPELVEMMHETGRLNNGRSISYALGLVHGRSHGVPVVSHTGATSGYRAYLARYPEQRLSVSLLCNVSNASPGSLGEQVAEVFLGEAASDVDEELPEGVDVPTERLDAKTGIYKNPLNGAPTPLVLEDDTLRVEGGPALIPLSSSRFQVGTSDREFVFEEADGRDRPIIQVRVDGYDEGIREPVASFDPTPDELQVFTGTFHSEDAETTLTLRVKDDELVAERRPDDEFSLTPVYESAFRASGFGLLRFRRGEEDALSSFSLSRYRVFDMRFERGQEQDRTPAAGQ